jgi:hypothetical protein
MKIAEVRSETNSPLTVIDTHGSDYQLASLVTKLKDVFNTLEIEQ